VIVDNLMNLDFLFWAAAHGGDSAYYGMAERHALTSARWEASTIEEHHACRLRLR
jgi:hypothetical protein